MASQTPDEREGEPIDALVDVLHQAVIAPAVFDRGVDEEQRPLTKHEGLLFEHEHMARSHATLLARLLIRDVFCEL
jgi:hypothetical protein